MEVFLESDELKREEKNWIKIKDALSDKFKDMEIAIRIKIITFQLNLKTYYG